ncbi:MAG: LysM peptidoglycan-binding domain-containing protein [Victivallales bacterium]
MKFIKIFSAVILLACLAGCGLKSKDEESHPLFKRAVKAQKAKETKLAVEYFQRYLVVNPESSKTHLMLASIYDETLDKPLQAVYHYERFLEFAPGSPEAENVRKWLEAAKKKYYYRARKEYNDPEDVAALQDTLYATEQELKKHKLELAKVKSQQKKLLIYARQVHNNEKKLTSELAELQATHDKTLAESAELKAKLAEKEKNAQAEKEKKEEKTEKNGKSEDKKDLKPEEKKPEKTEDEIAKDKQNETSEKTPETVKPETEKTENKTPEKTAEPATENKKVEEKTSPSLSPVVKAKPEAPPFTLKKTEKTENKAPEKERSYVVQKGDSLSSISRQFYGSARYYKIIFDANREILPTERALRPGQVLKIPAR